MNNKLPKEAYGGVDGKEYVPYLSGKSNKGSNLAVMIIGIILAALFAASTAYSGMKSGLTVAAGIPGAIIGSMFIKAFCKQQRSCRKKHNTRNVKWWRIYSKWYDFCVTCNHINRKEYYFFRRSKRRDWWSFIW